MLGTLLSGRFEGRGEVEWICEDGMMESVHGPIAPWCVGSVLFPPQLLRTEVDPLYFNPVGSPQCLLSNGHHLEYSGAVCTAKEIGDFTPLRATPFIPRKLIQDVVHEEANFNQAHGNQGSQFLSNRFQALKCSDGSVLVFFLSGKNADRIASTVCKQAVGGKWQTAQKGNNAQGSCHSEQLEWPASPCLQHSIDQLSAVWEHSSDMGGKGSAIVAARTAYHVFFCTFSREEEHVKFISTTVSKFQVPVAHVAWNPHINLEAAVVLETGQVCLFDVQAHRNGNTKGMVELRPKVVLVCPMERQSPTFSSQRSEEAPGATKVLRKQTYESPRPQESKQNWWRCEFGWLPQTLLVANSREVFLVNFKQSQGTNGSIAGFKGKEITGTHLTIDSPPVIATLADSDSTWFCTLKSREENILAFARTDCGGVFEFSIATQFHLRLFDTRQPHIPLLQWEHGMRQEPPNFLLMFPLSALPSLVNKDDSKYNQSGSAILAANFKSGELCVFCYGPKVSRAVLQPSSILKEQKVNSSDWGNGLYAWGMPSKIHLPQSDVADWRHVFCKSEELWFETRLGAFVPKEQKVPPNVAGFSLLFEPASSKSAFTILQLTGMGTLLAQNYVASDVYKDQPKATILNTQNTSDVEPSMKRKRKRSQALPTLEVLPAFLEYIHTGSVKGPAISKSFESQEMVTGHEGEGALNSEQGGASPETSGLVEKGKTLQLHTLEMTRGGLQTLLKAFVQRLDTTLSMYEIAQKVLSMVLPENLALLAAGMPSDLSSQRHRGYKFPLVSPLLQAMVPSDDHAEPGREDDSVDHSVSNELMKKRSLQKTVPLALLLELHNMAEPDLRHSKASPGESNPENMVVGELPHDVTFVGGHKLLQDGCQYLGGLIEKMGTKTEPGVISLSEPTKAWQDSANDQVESDSPIVIYSIGEQSGHPSDIAVPSNMESLIGDAEIKDENNLVNSAQDTDEGDLKKRSGAFGSDMHRKFVARKAGSGNQERHRFLQIDPLCPIQLSFTAPEISWDEEEVTALDNLHSDFLQWQQSFPLFKNAY